MRAVDLKERTRQFALRVVPLYCALPKSSAAQVLGKQALRAGTSVGAHYREAARARSQAEFISKLEVALQELDETDYWLALIADSEIIPRQRLTELLAEIQELTAILVASVKTAKKNR